MSRSNRWNLLLLVMLIGVLGNVNAACAQQNSSLLPPSVPGDLILACAEAAEDGNIHIIRSSVAFTVEKIDSDGEATNETSDEASGDSDGEDSEDDDTETKTEMVQQTYTVSVPYTEQVVVDGKAVTVTRMRTETRTRMVPMSVGVGGKDSQMVTYQVTIPYTEQVIGSDGNVKSIQRTRTESRTVMIGENERLVKKLSPVVYSLDPAKLKFYSLDGVAVSATDAMSHFAERLPIVLKIKDEPLDEFYQQILLPETLVVVDENDEIPASLLKAKSEADEDE